MRHLSLLVLIGLAAIGSAAHASPCITVTSPDADDVTVLRRALAAEFPATPRTCLDVSVVSVQLAETHTDITLTASVRVVISDDRGRMKSVLAGGATLTVSRAGYRARRMAMYRRDALEEAITAMLPALRTQVVPPSRLPTT